MTIQTSGTKTVKVTHVFTGQFTKAELDEARKNKEQNKPDILTRTEQKFQLS